MVGDIGTMKASYWVSWPLSEDEIDEEGDWRVRLVVMAVRPEVWVVSALALWDVTSFGVVGQMTPRATRPRVTPPLTTSLHRPHLCTTNTSNTAAGRVT
jgi:hypothetical protein